MQSEQKKLVVQLVGQLLIVDGVLADAEREYRDTVIARLSMADAERKAALSGSSVDSPIEERVGQLDEEAKSFLRGELDTAIGADGSVTRSESHLVEKVRAVLG